MYVHVCYLDLSVASLVYRNNNCKSIGVGKPVENSKFTRIKRGREREREREKRDTERGKRRRGSGVETKESDGRFARRG